MTTTPPPTWEILEQALRQRHPAHFTYHDRQRTVYPHTLGWNNAKAMLLAYQTAGQTNIDQPAQPQQG